MSALVACGGTGAHVALAFVRLHTLGHALGFFRGTGGPLEFPSIFLVDQDAGDGREEKTAWQLTRQLVSDHPAAHDWFAATGRPEPLCREVTPLPVGPDRNWFDAPNDRLERRFADSAYLSVLTAEPQRLIAYSRGMMGSPAVGSLLLELKKQDRNASGKNNEEGYERLLEERGRVAVVGSGVGGTGASVGPSLALEFERAGADVMAAMVLSWFRFETRGLDEETRDKAQLRNDAMTENANSALQYYGERLARHVATVPVGSAEQSFSTRTYTSDTQQPVWESYLHGVAALCALRHYTEILRPGLYQMGAEDPRKLGGGTELPGGTLQCLANRAATLADGLEAFAKVLHRARGGVSWSAVRPVLLEYVADPGRVGEELALLAGEFRGHLNWLGRVLKVEPVVGGDFTLERRVRDRLSGDPLRLDEQNQNPADTARVVFQWLARWITNDANSRNGLENRPGRVNGGYWPQLRGDGLSPAARGPGRLRAIPDQSIGATLAGFVDPDSVTPNGWPSPVAAADYFRYAIEQGRVGARRQLEMLLLGLMSEELELRELPEIDALPASNSNLSLERMVADRRAAGMKGLATHAVVYPRSSGEIVLGFNSPETLLAPVPLLCSDRANLEVWSELWAKLTGEVARDDWTTRLGRVEWRKAQAEVDQLRLWQEREVSVRGGQSPPWVRAIFEDQRGSPRQQAFGMGARLVARWGEDLIEISLPARRSGVSPPVVDSSIPVIDRAVLEARVDGLDRLEDESYSKVDFEVPGCKERLSGYWKEHLDKLQLQGAIAGYRGDVDNRQLRIFTQSDSNELEQCVLDDTLVLDRDALIVRSCTPLRQDPVPGSSFRPGEALFPTLPIRSDFLDLVHTADGQHLLNALKAGEPIDTAQFRPSDRQRAGNRVAEWSLHLRGRKEVQPYVLQIPDEPHRSHWMVWPNFRSTTGEPWRAYYVYDHCTDPRVRVDTLWLDPDTDTVRVRQADTEWDYGSGPLSFEAGSQRRHTGGPPLALIARNTVSDTEAGIYLVQLRPISAVNRTFRLGVDFGTSHTVAALRSDDDTEGRPVGLFPQLGKQGESRLSLHVSENRKHCDDDLLPSATWFPTYVNELPTEAQSLLPSELLTRRPLAEYPADRIGDWKPGLDCFIPPMNLGGYRNELARHIVSDFKWDSSYKAFRNREDALREIYLGMVLEQVLADVVEREQGLPAQVDVTFTYPLRSTPEEVKQYRHVAQRVLGSCGESMGIALSLMNGIGTYDESRAARGGTKQSGDVSVVADLGGGTLDLFISAEDAPGAHFREVADSVRLGANLLLRKLAASPRRFLPSAGGWSFGDVDECEKQLRAWMRERGSNALFGVGQHGSEAPILELRGFKHSAEAQEARALITRYFRLLVDYVARSVVAYLGTHWQEQAGEYQDRLKIWLQLRGNGWRLWHDSAIYEETQNWVRGQLRERVSELWSELDNVRLNAPVASRWQEATGQPENPKLAPICRAAGEALSDEEARLWRKRHVLVDLDLLGESAPGRKVRWYESQPFDVGSDSTRVELGRIEPPIRLSRASDEPVVLDDLATARKRRVNTKLDVRGDRNETEFEADVAAWVWEEAFESAKLLDDE